MAGGGRRYPPEPASPGSGRERGLAALAASPGLLLPLITVTGLACRGDEQTMSPLLRLEIDHSSGRQIVSMWEHSFREIATLDHERGLVYVLDASDPLAITAFSVEDGSVVGSYREREGEGSGELRGIQALAVSSHGVLTADGMRINRWDSEGSLASVWTPDVRRIPSVCWWMDEPAVPLPMGVLRRDSDGSGTVHGEGRARKGFEVPEEAGYASSLFAASRLVCIDDTAYVLDERLTGYSLDGRTFELPIPSQLKEASLRRRESARVIVPGSGETEPFVQPYSGLFDDGEGNLVVTLWASETVGAIIDPRTGCQSIILDSKPQRASRRLIGMYRDSVLVAGSSVLERLVNGVRTRIVDPNAYGIALHPLRAADGKPSTSAETGSNPDKVGGCGTDPP